MTRPANILVIDDDPAVVELLVEELAVDHTVTGETSPRAGLERAVTGEFDIVITDVEMPGLRGIDLLAELLERKPGQLVLMITAFGSIELAVQAVRAGACDFVTKPFKLPTLLLAVERALRERTMRREIVRLRRELGHDGGSLVASSPAMHKVLDLARRASRAMASVLITGESGSGKGALARRIHDHGPRASGPFVAVNCAALPSGLVEAELFGVRRGAFTDARESRDGLFVEAAGSTIYQPLSIPQQLEELFDQLLAKTSAIIDPFEQAFFAMVHIPYLQPFEDVNKRVSRLAVNIPFVKHNLAPLSFVDVPERDYIDGTLGVYELRRVELLRDVFAWAYERSCQRYTVVREALPQPDPLRLRNRSQLTEVVSALVRDYSPIDDVPIRNLAESVVAPEDLEDFVAMVISELSGLHEGNMSRESDWRPS